MQILSINPTLQNMQLNDFTLFVAIFAATLAAVNIFNAHLNNPFILSPIEDRVKFFKKKCDAVKQGLKLPFSKEKIDYKIKWLSFLQTGMKAVTFIYNAIVLCLWGYYSYELLEKEFNIDDAKRFLWIISSSSFVIVVVGVGVRIALPIISKTNKIQESDTENVKAANEQIANVTTESQSLS